MSLLSAVVFLPDDTAKTGYTRPMMLLPILGLPLLSWLASSLIAGGVGRFFLVCHEQYAEDAKACIPPEFSVTIAVSEASSEQLHTFLAESEEEDVLVVTGPSLILPFSDEDLPVPSRPIPSGVSSVKRQTLLDALDEQFRFFDFMSANGVPYTDRDGVYAVSSIPQLAEWKPVLARSVLYRLAANGVSIWDYDNTYAAPTVCIGSGSEILPGTVLRGHTVIGENCVIGPDCYLENATVESGCRINASQIADSAIGSSCTIGPYAEIRGGSAVSGGSVLGAFTRISGASIGEQAVISDHAALQNCTLGSGVQVGSGASVPAEDGAENRITIGSHTVILPGTQIATDIPDASTAFSRVRQSVKKDRFKRFKAE